MDNFEIGKTIRDLRTEHKYTQAQLGELLNVSDSAICKWESGESSPNIDQLHNIAKLFNLTVDELIHFQEKKNAERIKLEAEEKKRKEEKNRSVKEELKNYIFCKVWDNKQEFSNDARIRCDYDGTTLTLYQKEDPNIVLYNSVIGSNLRMTGKCYTLQKEKWELCSYFENNTDKWQILFDFDHPIERIRFSFDEEGIDDYEFLVKFVYADKEAYNKKIEAQKQKDLLEKAAIAVIRSSAYNKIVNVTFNATLESFSYAVIELYRNYQHKTFNHLKNYRLDQGEKIWMEDKLVLDNNYYFVLKQFDENDNLIVQSDFIQL